MGKCFLWLWGGFLFGWSYAVSELSSARASWAHCLSGAMEWILTGGVLTAAAVMAYALYTVCEQGKLPPKSR